MYTYIHVHVHMHTCKCTHTRTCTCTLYDDNSSITIAGETDTCPGNKSVVMVIPRTQKSIDTLPVLVTVTSSSYILSYI